MFVWYRDRGLALVLPVTSCMGWAVTSCGFNMYPAMQSIRPADTAPTYLKHMSEKELLWALGL